MCYIYLFSVCMGGGRSKDNLVPSFFHVDPMGLKLRLLGWWQAPVPT